MTSVEVLCGLMLLLGIAGTLIPVLPGELLLVAGLLIWPTEEGGGARWTFAVVALVVVTTGAVVKYLIPGRALKRSVSTATMLVAALAAVVGFFVVPVVGALLGFVVGVYLAEWNRVGHAAAWPSTKAALRAVGVGVLIEFTAAVLATLVFAVGVLTT